MTTMSQILQGRAIFVLTLLCVTSIARSTFAQPTRGLAAYYPFDVDARDASGNANDGVIHSASFVQGHSGSALSFEGSPSSYVEVPHSNLLTPSNGVTLSAWVKVRSYATWHSCLIYKAGDVPTSDGFKDRCFTLWATSERGLHISATPPDASSQISWGTPGGLYALNEVFHVAAVVDGEHHEFRIYVNGNFIGRAPYTASAIRGGSFPLRIGSPFFTVTDQSGLDGLLDDVCIYARALTNDEVLWLFTGAPVPRLTIRVSQVELCWTAFTNLTYQVQYRSMLSTNFWQSLGTALQGSDTTICVTDWVPVDEPQRLYRVLVVP